MKPIFKILLFLLVVILLSQCEKDEPNPQAKIPDDSFLNALIEVGIDTDGDGKISPAEAEVITFLNVSDCLIQDLTGIEAFVNMHTLYCHNNQLTTLDVSKCSALELLSCSGNRLTSLDVSNCTALKWLYCGDNQLTGLDLSNNGALHSLYCDSNQLGSLDVSNNIALSNLGCDRNKLTSLNVSNNAVLKLLNCPDNELTTLDVSNNTLLVALGCGFNQITALDISGNASLIWLHLNDMPSLYKVCVWEMPFPPAGVEVDTSGSPNVYFLTECRK